MCIGMGMGGYPANMYWPQQCPTGLRQCPIEFGLCPTVLSRPALQRVLPVLSDPAPVQVCKASGKKIGMRVRHSICTQCRKRFHPASVPQQHADCLPPAFGTPAAAKRIAPPRSSNLAAAVMHTSTSGRVPGIVEDLIAVLNSRGMVEGIYRVPGDKQGVKQLIDRYFSDIRRKRLGIYTIESIHNCSSALKQFLRELDEPLLTFDGYPDFIRAVKLPDAEARVEAVVEAVGRLPVYNFYTLRALMEHLQRVSDAVDVTRMKSSNLAAVFAPTLLTTPLSDEEGLRDVMAQMKCVDMLLKLNETAWNEAQHSVDLLARVQSASPVPERGGGGSHDSPNKRHSGIGLPSLAVPATPTGTTGTEPTGAPTTAISRSGTDDLMEEEDDAVSELVERDSLPGQGINRSNPLFRNSGLNEVAQAEVTEMLEEVVLGFGDDGVEDDGADVFGDDAVNVWEGATEDALLPGLEAFSFEDGEAATVTLVTRRKPRTGDRISGAELELADE
eukprot:m.996213 g.996213  ORF g.996213 m.996213 type:complete len:502 (-) comp24019_c0_seq26:1916-3421(-)